MNVNLNRYLFTLIAFSVFNISAQESSDESANLIEDVIVTSRRSDPNVEKKIQLELQNLPINYSAWFHQGAKNLNLAALFGSAENIFVTEDSTMMISESISSGKPVTTLFPRNIKSPRRYKAQIQKYLELNLITRESIENFSIKEIENSSKNIQSHLSNLCDQLEERIQWQEG